MMAAAKELHICILGFRSQAYSRNEIYDELAKRLYIEFGPKDRSGLTGITHERNGH